MTRDERAFAAAVASLAQLLDREKNIIKAREFKRLRSLAEEKRRLLAVLESAGLEGLSPAAAAQLTKALAELNRKAAENADALGALRQGALDARRRLNALAVEAKKLGFYTARGGEIRSEGVGSLARSA
jgi:flagellar biosynthesis/type III secretory pathway chaperone